MWFIDFLLDFTRLYRNQFYRLAVIDFPGLKIDTFCGLSFSHDIVLQRVVAIVARPRGAHARTSCACMRGPGGEGGEGKFPGGDDRVRIAIWNTAVANFHIPSDAHRTLVLSDLGVVVIVAPAIALPPPPSPPPPPPPPSSSSSVPTPGRSELLPCRPTGLPGLFAFGGRTDVRFDPFSNMNKTRSSLSINRGNESFRSHILKKIDDVFTYDRVIYFSCWKSFSILHNTIIKRDRFSFDFLSCYLNTRENVSGQWT